MAESSGPHRIDVFVRFGELDPYSHVNHTVYLEYFEHGRVAALGEIGQSLGELAARDVTVVVAQLSTRFLAPAHLGERLTVETALGEIGRATTTWLQKIRRGETVLVTQVTRVGCASREGRPCRHPPDLVEALSRFVVPSDWLGRDAPRW